MVRPSNSPQPEQNGDRRIEIVHEALLSKWPRLVRWQAQDVEGAQLRDELRQAAQVWDQHDRADDFLWSGTAFREYQLWHEHYPGGLSALEEAFTKAMTRLAERKQRRRRLAMFSVVAALLVVVGVISYFWRRSVFETHRAEAANLLSLARFELEDHPSAAIAYAIASLELADIPRVRELVVEALWRGPTEIRLDTPAYRGVDFSPDGRWLLTASQESWKLWPADGGPPTTFDNVQAPAFCEFSPNGELIAVIDAAFRTVGLWSFPEGRLLRTLDPGPTKTYFIQFSTDGRRLITSTEVRREGQSGEVLVQAWPLSGGEPKLMARLETPSGTRFAMAAVNPAESQLVWSHGRSAPPIETLPDSPLYVGWQPPTNPGPHLWFGGFDLSGQLLATIDSEQSARLWSLAGISPQMIRPLGDDLLYLRFDQSGSMLAAPSFGNPSPRLWILSGSPNSEPLSLERAAQAIEGDWTESGQGLAFHPKGTWLATGHAGSASLWPLTRLYPQVLRDHEAGEKIPRYRDWLRFTPDGKKLVSMSRDSIRVWSLEPMAAMRSRILFRAGEIGEGKDTDPSAMAPDGSFVAIGTSEGVSILPLDGGNANQLTGNRSSPTAVAVGPRSRLVAAVADQQIYLWHLINGEVRILPVGADWNNIRLYFTESGHLLLHASRGTERTLMRWNLRVDPPRQVAEIDIDGAITSITADGSKAVGFWDGDGGETVWLYKLGTDSVRRVGELSAHGKVNGAVLIDRGGDLVITGTKSGAVQVSPAQGGEPHLLLGHSDTVNKLAISPHGQWLASGGPDGTIRIWPMPDLSEPPFHTLPREEVVTNLRALTNLRATRDAESDTGWKLTIGPFPGWEEAPTW
jgi:WD40 repeat protein